MRDGSDSILTEQDEQRTSAPRIKRIAPEMRRRRIVFPNGIVWYKRVLRRLKDDSQFLRSSVQLAFALLCLWIGIEFYLFMKWGLSGGSETYVSRPSGVEGFLPISALISLKYWLDTSIVNTIHPSALFILLAIVSVSIVMKKSFCSWLCPVGTLSESLWLLGEKLFGKNISLPRWIDYPLRSLKYLLLLFFLWAVSGMDVPALNSFINSPYNRMADVKMYLFFAHLSTFALWTMITFMVLSVVVKNFWCRFLCPYGALLGILSWLSPLKITREASSCVDCELCTKVCPSNILVHKAGRVWSDECTSCMRCVEVCPVKETLLLRTSITKKTPAAWVYGILVAGIFVAVTGLAILSDHWTNTISSQEYLHRFQEIESPLYQH
ncbi:MAG TPA: 4Fe-4S binding protein [Bacteroidota bacterium]|nr:4Fe-4S binding protein [Bacteroidota bacterium]